MLYITQYEGGRRAGLAIQLDGINNYLSATDQYGNAVGDDPVQWQWRHRQFVLPSSLVGRTLVSGGIAVNGLTAPGHWDTYFRDITIVQANGTVIFLYKAGNQISLSPVPTGGATQISDVVESGAPLVSSTEDAAYFLDDHLEYGPVHVARRGRHRDASPYAKLDNPQSLNPVPICSE